MAVRASSANRASRPSVSPPTTANSGHSSAIAAHDDTISTHDAQATRRALASCVTMGVTPALNVVFLKRAMQPT
jgi:hypothetical protein